MYRAIPTQVDLPALDQEILHFWHANSVFRRSLEQSLGRPEWVFYEGPPTANGMPGAHHIEARVFKDVFPRYKTMRVSTSPGRRAGTATGSRSSSPSRRNWAFPSSRTLRSSALPSSTLAAASR
ncbi:hypothetical protein JOD64_002718 [Micromonospora luteifusca]|uniref:Aminoacyl-tRNA synthetase class Ia domain-containing protein n=1 Tax=Micromonospora luteifusca TaxID=709860 RepID=A0ABS2LTI3_9ACTN|nr:hypothetical protein [Micromonospora luteifusca]